MSVYFFAIRSFLRPFGLFEAIWFTYYVAIWYILWLFGIFLSSFGMLCQETSGNPVLQRPDEAGASFQLPVRTKVLFNGNDPRPIAFLWSHRYYKTKLFFVSFILNLQQNGRQFFCTKVIIDGNYRLSK
jgi:hypothetical protein